MNNFDVILAQHGDNVSSWGCRQVTGYTNSHCMMSSCIQKRMGNGFRQFYCRGHLSMLSVLSQAAGALRKHTVQYANTGREGTHNLSK